MKVNFPIKSKESIDFGAIDFMQGIVLTTNPHGYIQYIGGTYYFYTVSDGDYADIHEDTLPEFVDQLFEEYPNINAEYYEK